MAWKVTLPEFPHCEALRELHDALALALDGKPGDGEVWLGGHTRVTPPAEAVIFQTEAFEAFCFTEREYHDRLTRARAVWDYSTVNMAAYPAQRKIHVPLGRSPAFERIKRKADPVHAFGFFGSENARRRAALPPELEPLPFGMYGEERDVYAGNCKVVLVPHYYPNAPAEQVRILPLCAAGICVLAEYAPDFAEIPGCFVPYEKLAEAARAAISTGDWEIAGEICRAEYDRLPSFSQIVERAIACTPPL